MKRLLCRLLGHKYVFTSVQGRQVIQRSFRPPPWWTCDRCGAVPGAR